eukprot:3476453-Lingulodinium_polyedra.AAC.1
MFHQGRVHREACSRRVEHATLVPRARVETSLVGSRFYQLVSYVNRNLEAAAPVLWSAVPAPNAAYIPATRRGVLFAFLAD